MNNIISFFKEYKELCLKYEFFVGGCGCCESPYFKQGRDKKLIEKYQLDDLKEHFRHLENDELMKISEKNKCVICGAVVPEALTSLNYCSKECYWKSDDFKKDIL